MNQPLQEKLCSADEAVRLIRDGQTVACSGFVSAGHPEALTSAIERLFTSTGTPRDLTLVYAAGQGDGKTRGLNHLAYEGLIKRVIGGHIGLAPKMGKLVIENKIEAYNFPQGVICHLFRDIAAGRPGCITHIGLDTFIDPDNQGGCKNDISRAQMVERVELGGKTWLWYKAFPIQIALIRATAADRLGNLVMDRECLLGEVLAIAQAVHNSGGLVLAQVGELLPEAAAPQRVRVPGILVDRIILAESHEHQQTYGEVYNPNYCLPTPNDESAWPQLEHLPMDERRVIAARACDELSRGAIANLGIGMPEGISKIAAERGLLNTFTLTVESGLIGGMPASGFSFGASVYPHAVIDQAAQFDFYDGGGLDFAALGAAQIDAKGNVNVSKFGTRLAGVGGFVNITQTAKTLVFCGTFTAGGLEVQLSNGTISIIKEGTTCKFVREVEQISFSAHRSRQVGQKVLYVTERAVFKLTEEGLELIELAPGINLQKQVLDLMEFQPIIHDIRPMLSHVFLKTERISA
jgi:propionate CoA-transferase